MQIRSENKNIAFLPVDKHSPKLVLTFANRGQRVHDTNRKYLHF
jgi:hypothetical protein